MHRHIVTSAAYRPNRHCRTQHTGRPRSQHWSNDRARCVMTWWRRHLFWSYRPMCSQIESPSQHWPRRIDLTSVFAYTNEKMSVILACFQGTAYVHTIFLCVIYQQPKVSLHLIQCWFFNFSIGLLVWRCADALITYTGDWVCMWLCLREVINSLVITDFMSKANGIKIFQGQGPDFF